MATETVKINESQVEVLAAVFFYDYNGSENPAGYMNYYVGFCDEHGIACRLSPYFRTRQEACDAVESGNYTTEVSVLEYPNGSKLLFSDVEY